MKTKEEILRDVINETIGNPETEKYLHHIHQDIAIKAMQEYSEQQTANLKLINAKQAELIEWLETECQSPETADLSHSFAENLMIKLAGISYLSLQEGKEKEE